MYDGASIYDQLSLERTVKGLSNLGIRQSPLTWEKAKRWARQFDEGPEKALAWLILRFLVFRTTDQLESSIRQALKAASQDFGRKLSLPEETDWRAILEGRIGDLNFYCSPPTLATYSLPGKSGELIARLVNRVFKVDKSYAHDFSVIGQNERLLIVDDGTFTGEQLSGFLDNYMPAGSSPDRVAVVVAIAHEAAIAHLAERHPNVAVFCGEVLSKSHCFESLSLSWVSNRLWPYLDVSPLDVYKSICEKHNLTNGGSASLGFGSLGVMVGYEHGIPDDSLNLLWEKSETWLPLIER
ncbi:phosphoribosyltransferase-like protein [Metapseudomonas furukawaii]